MNTVAMEASTTMERSDSEKAPMSRALQHEFSRPRAENVRTKVVSRYRGNGRQRLVAACDRLLNSLFNGLAMLCGNPAGLYPTSDFLRMAANLTGKGGLSRKGGNGALDGVHGVE